MKSEYAKIMMMILTKKTGERIESTPHTFQKIEVCYMTKAGVPDTRTLGVAIPEGVTLPIPVAFVAHYGIDESTVGENELLKHGIAVAGALNVMPEENAKMADDDLYFSSACVDVLRGMPEVDRGKLIITGGSAGGFMTMMLTAIHLNIAASICNSGVLNFCFTGNYVSAINKINYEALRTVSEEPGRDLQKLIELVPFPLHGSVFPTFGYNHANVDEYKYRNKFGLEFSPVYYYNCYSNPVLFTHFTADSLVPIDQVTRKYTYEVNGDSIPRELSTRMSDYDLPAGADKSMDELLPPEQIHMTCIKVEEIGAGTTVQAPFDPEKKYNFVICDDGPVEAYYGHMAYETCQLGIAEYAVRMLKNAPEARYDLSKEKILLMMERYAGTSKLIPGFINEDNNVYGTPEMNKRSVLSELRDYVKDTGNIDALRKLLGEVAEDYPEFHETVEECKTLLL